MLDAAPAHVQGVDQRDIAEGDRALDEYRQRTYWSSRRWVELNRETGAHGAECRGPRQAECPASRSPETWRARRRPMWGSGVSVFPPSLGAQVFFGKGSKGLVEQLSQAKGGKIKNHPNFVGSAPKV